MTVGKNLKIDLKNKMLISSACFVLVIFSLIYFIVIPTIKDIKSMGDIIEAQKIDLEKKYIKGQSLKQLSENLNKIEPKLTLLEQIFINKNRELEFITSLEAEANKNKVEQKINMGSPQLTENGNFQKTDLQLLTKGDFVSQLKYLADLESLSYYINVKSLELSPSDISAAQINMLLNTDIYWN
jgi:hypothetical protein